LRSSNRGLRTKIQLPDRVITPNVAGSLLLIGSKRLAASLFEGRNEELCVHRLGGVGEASSLCFFPRGQSGTLRLHLERAKRDASLTFRPFEIFLRRTPQICEYGRLVSGRVSPIDGSAQFRDRVKRHGIGREALKSELSASELVASRLRPKASVGCFKSANRESSSPRRRRPGAPAAADYVRHR
jgi:hypothetical protein